MVEEHAVLPLLPSPFYSPGTVTALSRRDYGRTKPHFCNFLGEITAIFYIKYPEYNTTARTALFFTLFFEKQLYKHKKCDIKTNITEIVPFVPW